MLFEKIRKAKLTNFTGMAKAKAIALGWKKTLDPQFVEYVVNRYTSAANATSNTSPIEVYRGSDRKCRDEADDLTIGTPYYFKVFYIDLFDNECVYSDTLAITYTGTKTTDLVGTIADDQIEAVSAVKIAGEIVNAQIADAAINVAKFASGLRPVEILAALPTTGNVDGRLVFLTTDKKLYRYDATVGVAAFVKTVDGADIAANSIAAGKIQAGAISTAELAAGGITASKIAVGTFSDNLILDGDFESGAIDTWLPATSAPTVLTNNVDATSPSGGRSLSFDRSVTNNTQSMNRTYATYFPVEALDSYYAEFTIKGSGASAAGAFLRLVFYDGAKAPIIDPATGINYRNIYADGPITTSWVTKSGIYASPVGTKYIRVQIFHHSSSTIQTMYVSGLILKKLISGDLIVNGTISGQKMVAGSITADKIDVTNLIVDTINIRENAILPSRMIARDTTNILRDNQLDEMALWTLSKPAADTGVLTMTSEANFTPGNIGYSRNRFVLNTTKKNLIFSSQPDIPIEDGQVYQYSCYVKTGNTGVTAYIQADGYQSQTGGLVRAMYITDTPIALAANTVTKITMTAALSSAVSFGKWNLVVDGTTDGMSITVGSPSWRRIVDSGDVFSESIVTSKIRDWAVTTLKIADSAVTQKYQSLSSGSVAITTGNLTVLTDTATWGSDYEWIVFSFSWYTGANASSIPIIVEFLQGANSLVIFQAVTPVRDMVTVTRAFSKASFEAAGVTGNSGNINIRVTTSTGTVNISDKQLITKVYKR